MLSMTAVDYKVWKDADERLLTTRDCQHLENVDCQHLENVDRLLISQDFPQTQKHYQLHLHPDLQVSNI